MALFNISILKFLFISLCVRICVQVSTQHDTCIEVGKLGFSFRHVCLGDWTQDIRLGGKCLPYPVSHLPSPCSPLPKETQNICFQRHGQPLEVKAIVCVWHASRVVRGQSGDFSPAFRGLGLECRCQAATVSSFTCWAILPANFSFPWQFLCTCVCMCVGTFLSGALSYIWRRGFSLFCLVWLAPCSGDPIPAFVAWPLKVDHCVLAFYMGSGGSELLSSPCLAMFSPESSLSTIWELCGHWKESYRKKVLSGRVIYTGKVQGKKNHSKKMICDDCISYVFMFSKSGGHTGPAHPSKGLLACWSQVCRPAGILILGSTGWGHLHADKHFLWPFLSARCN